MTTPTEYRLSRQRDMIYEGVVTQFRVHMKNDDVDSALALADEFFEWMDPDQLEEEPTIYFNCKELQTLYDELTTD